MSHTRPRSAPAAIRPRQQHDGVRPAAEDSFQHALDEAAAIATLSPSSHNCQPWGHAWLKSDRARAWARELLQGHSVQGDAAQDLLARGLSAQGLLAPGLSAQDLLAQDRDGSTTVVLALAQNIDRSLSALPAHSAEMLLSCGSYWHHLLRALAVQGWLPTAVHHLDPDAAHQAGLSVGTAGADWPHDWRMLSLAVLSRSDAPPPAGLATFRDTAAARHTNRAPYRDLAVAPEALNELANLSPTVNVRHLRSPTDLRRFATFVGHRAGRDFSDEAAWRETHSYFRWSAEEAATHQDGFTPEQVFGPASAPRRLLARAALNPAVLPRLCRLGFDRYLGAQLAQTARATPVITTAGLPMDDPITPDLLTAGMWLAEYWLTATRAGLALHPLSVLTQHEDLRADLQQRFGLPGRTFFVARLGYPSASAAGTLRRPSPTLAF